MKDYESYMRAYWAKYPDEEEHDYTFDELSELMASGAEYHLTDYIFIVYEILDDCVKVIFYCCDAGKQDIKTVKYILLQHKKFVSSFNMPVYVDGLKGLFKRGCMSKYDEDKKLWRFV